MTQNTSISLTSLDFSTLKNNLKNYLSSQVIFKDYEWEGSNINVLLDILTYNTYQNSFYLNMVAGEMFLDSAQMRDSVVSHAKELNYAPGSFTSAEAVINLIITSSDATKTSLTIPKGTEFTARVGANNFVFTTADNNVVQGAGIFTLNNLTLYEGRYITETFNTTDSANSFTLSNENVDTNSISVTVIEDSGSTILTYSKAVSLFGLDDTSEVFFVQGAGDQYQVFFGDGVIGRSPKLNSVVAIEYRLSSGELPNGAKVFKSSALIDGESAIVTQTTQAAQRGSIAETIDSIKFNAPRHFTTQERAVSAEDYENLLKINFSEVNAVSAFGGEDQVPPVYGKVFIAVDIKDIDGLPDSKKQEYYSFLKARSPLSIDPVFVDPVYLYIEVTSQVNYNINVTALSPNDIKTYVVSAILDYANLNLDNFNKILRCSKLTTSIDNSDVSVVSNSTTIRVIQELDLVALIKSNASLNYGFAINPGIVTQTFQYKGRDATLVDNAGVVSIVTSLDSLNVGTINYTTGVIDIKSFEGITSTNVLRVSVSPVNNDISSNTNTIINILDSDIILNIISVRE